MNESINIGRISRTHGVKGYVLLELYTGIELDAEEITFLLLSENGAPPVPWFVESMTEEKKNFLVKFEDIESSDEAQKLIGKEVYCDEDLIFENELNEYVGFVVEDEKAGVLGEINSIEEFPGQIIMTIRHPSGKEILLPMNENFVKNVDKERKRIEYAAPEGLLDVYLT